MSDGPSDMFSKLFSPLLIVVPAWSRSMESFKRLANDTMDSFTSFIVADACSAVYDKGDFTFGKGFIVTKDKTIVGNKPVDVINKNCDKTKCDNGCLLVIDYDFTYEKGDSKYDPPIKNTLIEQVEL